MEFEYFYTTTAMGSLIIDDLFDCAIEASNDMGEFYYLVVKCQDGFCQLFEYGPIIKDNELLPKTVMCSFKRITPELPKIKKAIQNFLNNPYHEISQAVSIDENEAYNNCINIIDYMRRGMF